MSVPIEEELWLRAFLPMARNIEVEISLNKSPLPMIEVACELMEKTLPMIEKNRGGIASDNLAMIIKKVRDFASKSNFKSAHEMLFRAWYRVRDGSIAFEGAADRAV